MKKISCMIISIILIFSFVSCEKSGNTDFESETSASETVFTSAEDRSVISNDGTKYNFVGTEEGAVRVLGKTEFVGHIEGEKTSFSHLGGEIKTGMYSVNGDRDVLIRYVPDNEWYAVYVRDGLLNTEVSLEKCVRFVYVDGLLMSADPEILNTKKGITDTDGFLDEIRSSQSARDAGLFEAHTKADGLYDNITVCGYICGVLQDGLNVVIPLEVLSFNGEAYSICIDDEYHVLSEEWLDRARS